MSLEVEGNLQLPNAPLLLAITDDDFLFEASMGIAKEGGEAGLCLYHLDSTYTAVGCSTQGFTIHTAIQAYHTISTIIIPQLSDTMHWALRRTGVHFSIGYHAQVDDPIIWVHEGTLPAMEQSVSFGPYFANKSNTPYQGWMENIRYRKG